MASNLYPNKETSSTTPSTSVTNLTLTSDEMKTPFSDINKPFRQAAIHSENNHWSFQKGDISVEKFNAAITGFLAIFDALGSPILTEIVRKDFRGKTNGLKNSARRLRAENLRDLVRKELKSPPRFWAPSGIESLLWSHRILRFVEQLVNFMVEDSSMELKDACILSYRSTLSVRHPQVMKVIFEKALHLVPPKNQFIANLTQHDEATEEDLKLSLIGMKDFLRATRPHIEALQTLFDMEEIEDLQ